MPLFQGKVSNFCRFFKMNLAIFAAFFKICSLRTEMQTKFVYIRAGDNLRVLANIRKNP